MNAQQASQRIEQNNAYLALIEDDGDCPEIVAALLASTAAIKAEFSAVGVFFI